VGPVPPKAGRPVRSAVRRSDPSGHRAAKAVALVQYIAFHLYPLPLVDPTVAFFLPLAGFTPHICPP